MSVSDSAIGTAPSPTEALCTIIDSCHSTWVFDRENRRFRRFVKTARQTTGVSTSWRSYDRVLLDSDAEDFIVFLDSSGNRLLRSWRHVGSRCKRCGADRSDATAEMSLAELLGFVSGRSHLGGT